MSAKDALLQKGGKTIRESIGADQGVQEAVESAEQPPQAAASAAGRKVDRKSFQIELGRITPDPDQPRQVFNQKELEGLAASLKKHGQLQPLVVYWNEPLGKYLIVCGERRLRAAQLVALPALDCRILDRAPTPAERLELQLVENLQRVDLNPLEQAITYDRLMKEFGYTQEKLSENLQKPVSQSAISKTLSLLKLPHDLKAQVEKKQLPAYHAYRIASLADEDAMRQMAERYRTEKLTQAQIDQAVQELRGRRNHATSKTGQRFSCKVPSGDSVTVSSDEALSLDRLIEDLEALLKDARKARTKGTSFEEFRPFAKAKGGRPAKGDQQDDS